MKRNCSSQKQQSQFTNFNIILQISILIYKDKSRIFKIINDLQMRQSILSKYHGFDRKV
jgi:hypothetical protein